MSRSTVFSSSALSSAAVLFGLTSSSLVAETSPTRAAAEVALVLSSDKPSLSTFNFLASGLSFSLLLGRLIDLGESVFFTGMVDGLAGVGLRGVRDLSTLEGVVGAAVEVEATLGDFGVVFTAALGVVRVAALAVEGVVFGDAFADVVLVEVGVAFDGVETVFLTVFAAALGVVLAAATFAAAALGDPVAAVLVRLAVVTPCVLVAVVARAVVVRPVPASPPVLAAVAEPLLPIPTDLVVVVDGFVPVVPVDGLLVGLLAAVEAGFFAAAAVPVFFGADVEDASSFSFPCFFFSSISLRLSAAASFFCCSFSFLSSNFFFFSCSCCSLSLLAFSIFSFMASEPLALDAAFLVVEGLAVAAPALDLVGLADFLVPAVPVREVRVLYVQTHTCACLFVYTTASYFSRQPRRQEYVPGFFVFTSAAGAGTEPPLLDAMLRRSPLF